jgi:hypothetical protein
MYVNTPNGGLRDLRCSTSCDVLSASLLPSFSSPSETDLLPYLCAFPDSIINSVAFASLSFLIDLSSPELPLICGSCAVNTRGQEYLYLSPEHPQYIPYAIIRLFRGLHRRARSLLVFGMEGVHLRYISTNLPHCNQDCF